MIRRLLVLGVAAALIFAGLMTAAIRGNVARAVATAPPAAVQAATAGPALVQSPHEEDGTSATEAEDADVEEKEKESEQEADENLPNGGHADPEGVDVEHQFEGIE